MKIKFLQLIVMGFYMAIFISMSFYAQSPIVPTSIPTSIPASISSGARPLNLAIKPGSDVIAQILKYKNDLLAVSKNPNYNYLTTAILPVSANSTPAPIDSNTNSIPTIVVFYDYNCRYSRDLLIFIKTELEKNKYRIIYRPVGMLADTSKLVAEVALAAFTKNKFQEFNNELTKADILMPITIDGLKTVAQRLGLNYDELIQIASTQQLGNEVLNNQVVYDSMMLPGVPSIIVAKLDSNNNVINDKIFFLAGADSNQLEYSLYKIRM